MRYVTVVNNSCSNRHTKRKLILSCHWMNENREVTLLRSSHVFSPDLIVRRDFLSVTVIAPVRSQSLGERNFRSHNRQGTCQSIPSSNGGLRGHGIHSNGFEKRKSRQFISEYSTVFQLFFQLCADFQKKQSCLVRPRGSGVPGSTQAPVISWERTRELESHGSRAFVKRKSEGCAGCLCRSCTTGSVNVIRTPNIIVLLFASRL